MVSMWLPCLEVVLGVYVRKHVRYNLTPFIRQIQPYGLLLNLNKRGLVTVYKQRLLVGDGF